MVYIVPTNVTDLADFTSDLSGQAPFLFPTILFGVWLIITMAGYGFKQRTTERGDFAMWFTIGGFITTTMSFMFFLIPGILNLETVIIVMTVTFVGAIWYFVIPKDVL